MVIMNKIQMKVPNLSSLNQSAIDQNTKPKSFQILPFLLYKNIKIQTILLLDLVISPILFFALHARLLVCVCVYFVNKRKTTILEKVCLLPLLPFDIYNLYLIFLFVWDD